MRVAVVGLGAVGGLIAARLARSGIEVCGLARGATLQAVRRDGLQVIEIADGRESRFSAELKVSDDPRDLGTPDVVVLAVKAPALHAVAPSVAALLGEHTSILCAMNGVPWWFFHGLDPALAARRWGSIDPDGSIASQMPVDRVIGSVLHLGASTPAPGVVRLTTPARIIVGEPQGGQSERSHRVADALEVAGFITERAPVIQQEVWLKLWGNMTMNPVSAITGATADRLLDDDLVRGFLSQVMIEAAQIGARIGLPISMTPEARHAITRQIGAAKTSMLQDVEAGRAIELDALVGAVQEIGRVLQVPTPFTDALFGVSRLFARVKGLYPPAPPAQP